MDARPPDPRIAASRTAVLDAVTELLGEKGVAGVTIDEVLKRSKVARATLYRHWPNRRALVLDGLARLMKVPSLPSEEGGLRDRLTAYVNTIADQFESQGMARLMPSLLEASWRDPELAEQMPAFHEPRRAPVREIIRDAKATGEIDPDIDPELALAQLAGPLLFRRLILGEPLSQSFREAIVRDFLAAHGTGGVAAEGRP